MSLRKPKLSRHIKVNHTNIALLFQEAKQKYRKLSDYRTKCCYLSALAIALLSLPSQGIFSSWTQS